MKCCTYHLSGGPVIGGAEKMTNEELERIVLKTQAAREVENCMNKYEYLMSHDQFEYVYDNLFAINMPDVRMELPFGKWVGPDSLRRCVVNYHSRLCLDESGLPIPGVMFFNVNAQSIIEVADDLKTAKGLWVCPGFGALVTPDNKHMAVEGTAKRACDFICDETDGRWKMWHYRVSGWTSHPYGVSFVDDKSEGQSEGAIVFTEDTKPDGPPDYYWQYSTTRRVNYYPPIPVPYRTFDETFSY